MSLFECVVKTSFVLDCLFVVSLVTEAGKFLSLGLVVVVDLLSDELSADQVLVDPVEVEKLLMSATLLDQTMLHHDDLVGVSDSAEPMSYDNDGLLATVDEQV